MRLDPLDDTLTVYANTQMPHRAKQILVAALGIGEQRIRVVAPDVGGGFGPKAVFHPEELALPAAALLLRQPLKWIEDRRENFVAAVGERDQVWDMEMAFDADGRHARACAAGSATITAPARPTASRWPTTPAPT